MIRLAPDSETPLDALKNLMGIVRFHVSPKWKDGGFTHAMVPKDLPAHFGGFEVFEDAYLPINKGFLSYPSGKVFFVGFVKGDSEEKVSNV
jgi:hypothetical protein